MSDPIIPSLGGCGRLLVRDIRAVSPVDPEEHLMTEGQAARAVEELAAWAVAPLLGAGEELAKLLRGRSGAETALAEWDALAARCMPKTEDAL